MLKIENYKRTFFQALKINDYLPIKFLPYIKTSKTSPKYRC